MMDIVSVCVIAVALAMDAFSVSITKGFTQKNLTKAQWLYYGIFFGFFQFFMTVLGYLCGTTVSGFISSIESFVGFILLMIIGVNMIRESLTSDDEEITDNFSFKEVFILAIATSIDAFAVGLSFEILGSEVLIPSIIIGVTAFIISLIGVFIGAKLEDKIGKYLGDKVEIFGGVVLIIIAIKILIGL